MTKGWQEVPLGKLLTRIKNEVLIEDLERYQRLTIHGNNKGISIRDEFEGHQIGTKKQFVVHKGQFLLSKIDAMNGAFGIVPEHVEKGIITSNFWAYDVDEENLLSKYFNYLTHTRTFQQFCIQSSSGTTHRKYLQENLFLGKKIPLPSLDEQRLIVERVETLAARITKAQLLREEIDAETELLPAAEFKKLRYELLESKFSKNKLGDITQVTAGGTPSRDNSSYWNGHIPWIRTGELLDDDIYSSGEHITEEGMKNSSAKLFPKETILIALYGQGQTRGRTGRLMIEATTNQACCAILPTPDLLEPRFTQYWLRSLYYEMREQNHGGAQPNWNGAMIKNIEISIPPLDEQRRIVAYLDSVQARLASLRELQSATGEELSALLPSVLDRAFKGEL